MAHWAVGLLYALTWYMYFIETVTLSVQSVDGTCLDVTPS